MDTTKVHKSVVQKTHPQFNEFAYTWIIENFEFPSDSRRASLSPVFTVYNNEDKFELQLELTPRNICINAARPADHKDYKTCYMQLVLHRISSPNVIKVASVRLSFLFNDNESKVVKYDNHALIRPSSDNSDNCDIATGTLYWSVIEESGHFSRHNDLTAKLLIRFYNGDRHDEVYSDASSGSREKSLSNDFESLLMSPRFSDFKLIVADKEFPVHKNILAARSPFFRSMFESGMRENAENAAELEDISPRTMGEVLRYLYTGGIEGGESVTVDLLRAADKYALDDLNLMCAKALTRHLSVASLPGVLEIACQLEHCHHLRDAALRFMTTHGREVMSMENFDEVMQSLPPTMLSQVIKGLLGRMPY